jgi:hypothetical protein
MSAKSILEADGKAILNYHLTRAPLIKPSPLPKSGTHNPPPKLATLNFPEDADIVGVLDAAETKYPWLLVPGSKFVAKPDQLIKRRGKSGLLALNKTWPEARAWIEARAKKEQRVETVDGVLRNFLVEPFVPHPDGTEYYICIQSVSNLEKLILGGIRTLTNWLFSGPRGTSKHFTPYSHHMKTRPEMAIHFVSHEFETVCWVLARGPAVGFVLSAGRRETISTARSTFGRKEQILTTHPK